VLNANWAVVAQTNMWTVWRRKELIER
jgi:hypothetical protein